MTPTNINPKASNWVDRGEAPNHTLRRVLAHYFERQDPAHEPWLEEHANTILGMVSADSTEVHLAGYLRSLERDEGIAPRESRETRRTAVALWHIGKAALVRDFAERVMQGGIPANAPTPDSFSHWVASRLLLPEELESFEDDVLRKRELALRTAQLRGDVRALEDLIDDALVFTGPDGNVYSKQDDLAAHRSGAIRITHLEPSDEHIQRFDGIAVVHVRMEMAGTFTGAPFAGAFRYLRVWCLRADGWRIVAGQVSAVSS